MSPEKGNLRSQRAAVRRPAHIKGQCRISELGFRISAAHAFKSYIQNPTSYICSLLRGENCRLNFQRPAIPARGKAEPRWGFHFAVYCTCVPYSSRDSSQQGENKETRVLFGQNGATWGIVLLIVGWNMQSIFVALNFNGLAGNLFQ